MRKRTHLDPDQLAFDLRVKRCSCCQHELSSAEFCRDKNRKDGLAVYCRGCAKAKKADWYGRRAHVFQQKNRDRHKKWRMDNLEYDLERNRRWAAKNPEKKRAARSAWHKANAAEQQAANKAWREEHPEIVRAYGIARQARVAAATIVPFTPQQLAQRWAYYGNKCWLCRVPAQATDHVKPLAKGGAHMLCNLRPICNLCNSTKRSQWPYPVKGSR